jgi:stage II sporulation protein D
MKSLRAVTIWPLSLITATALIAGSTTWFSGRGPAGEGFHLARLSAADLALTSANSCPDSAGSHVPDAKVNSAAAGTASGAIIVLGHGWGHGMGMSQYGAQGAALLGCNHATILSKYYQGTHLGTRRMIAPVILSLAGSAARTSVKAVDGAVTWREPDAGTVTQPQGSTWTVTASATNGVFVTAADGSTQVVAGPGRTLVLKHAKTTVAEKSFSAGASSPSSSLKLRQGALKFHAAAGSATFTVREVISSSGTASAVEKYLWGLAEVPVSWPVEALKAQADAARTYLTHSYSSSQKAYLIGVTTAAQVYRTGGAQQ